MAPLKLLRPDIDRRFRGTDIALALKVGARGILVSGEFSTALMGAASSSRLQSRRMEPGTAL
jgi:hypothetical protein